MLSSTAAECGREQVEQSVAAADVEAARRPAVLAAEHGMLCSDSCQCCAHLRLQPARVSHEYVRAKPCDAHGLHGSGRCTF